MSARQSTTFSKLTSDDLSALFLSLSLCLVWFTLFSTLAIDWSTNPQYSYGWGVPILSAYLGWNRWKTRPRPSGGSTTWVVACLVVSCLFYFPLRFIQESHPDWRLINWTAGLVAVLLTWLVLAYVGGRSWRRHFIFPAFFALIALPWPTFLENLVIQSLMKTVAAITVEVLYFCGIIAVQEGNTIRLLRDVVGVSEACSGVRSIQAMLMASLFMGELYRFNPYRRSLLIVAGIGFAFVFNVVRAVFLTMVVEKSGGDALHAWHDPAGFLILFFSFTLLCLMTLPWILQSRGEGDRDPDPSPVKAAINSIRMPPRVISMGFMAWLVLVEAANETWYRYHESLAAKPKIWQFKYPEKSGFTEASIPEETRQILRYSSGHHWVRADKKSGLWLIWFVEWDPGKSSALLARSHSPEICLSATGLKQTQDMENAVIALKTGMKLPFRVYRFSNGLQDYLVYFCLWEDHPFSGKNPVPEITVGISRKARLEAVLKGERHNGQRMLQVVVGGFEDPEMVSAEIESFIASHVVF